MTNGWLVFVVLAAVFLTAVWGFFAFSGKLAPTKSEHRAMGIFGFILLILVVGFMLYAINESDAKHPECVNLPAGACP